jgi:hypothetical protein
MISRLTGLKNFSIGNRVEILGQIAELDKSKPKAIEIPKK